MKQRQNQQLVCTLFMVILTLFPSCSDTKFKGGKSADGPGIDSIGGAGSGAAESNSDAAGTDTADFGNSGRRGEGDIELDSLNDSDDLRLLCRDNAKVEAEEIRLEFASTYGARCAIGSRGDETFNAATTQTETFSIPDQSRLCSLNLEARADDFEYDDTAFLTLNGFVLATSSFNKKHFGPTAGGTELYKLDVAEIISRKVNRYGGPGNYCAPGSQCEFPESESPGRLHFKLGNTLMAELPDNSLDENEFEVGLTIGGNGDQDSGNRDCQHNGLILEATIEYISR